MAIGIDFGTTNSAVVYNRDQLLDESDELPMPSLVAIDPLTGQTIVGQSARRKRNDLERGSWHVVSSVKLSLSHDRSLAEKQGQKLNSTDISSILFAELKQRAEKLFGAGRADEAVVSIPVGLRAGARRRIRKAADRAGVHVLEFISEPTAAFLACRDQLPDSERVVVFDWGGGTLDVSVLQIEGQAVHELATASLQQAGDVIDEIVARHIHTATTKTEFDRAKLPAKTYDRLLVEAESAKRALADSPTSQVFLTGYLGNDHTLTIDRACLHELTASIVSQAVELTSTAIQRASAVGGEAPVDHIILVGGSSRLWGIKTRLHEAFPDVDIFTPSRPQWAVAQGASLLAEELMHGRNQAIYKLNHPVFLILSDGAPLPLVRAGDRFDDHYRRHHLAIVEDSHHAQLIFAVPDSHVDAIVGRQTSLRSIDFLSVPLQGLPLERLRLDSMLTRELTLRIRAQTEKADPDREAHWTTWEYEQLLFSYELTQNTKVLLEQHKQRA